MKTTKKIFAFLMAVMMAVTCFGLSFPAVADDGYEVGDEYSPVTIIPEGSGRAIITDIYSHNDGTINYELIAEPNEGYLFAGWYQDGYVLAYYDSIHIFPAVPADYSIRFIPDYKVGDRFYIPEQYDPGDAGYAVVTDIGTRNSSYGPEIAYTVEAVANEGYRFVGWFHYHKEELMVYSTGVILSEGELLDLHPKFEKKPTGLAAIWERIINFFNEIVNWIRNLF